MRNNYWSDSKLANAIRGTAKPEAASMGGWRTWEAEAKSLHPVRYWIAETLFDWVQEVVYSPLDLISHIKYVFLNRYVSKTHALTSNLPRGDYHEFDTRMLYCLFDELVNYVEYELAWFHVLISDDASDKFVAPFTATGFFRTRGWRCAEAGLEHLKWESTLVMDESYGIDSQDPRYGQLTSQATGAIEIMELYDWWVNVYPHRLDPYDTSGWSDLCSELPFEEMFNEDLDDVIKKRKKEALDRTHDLEEQYENEDTAMMIRLIKIRKRLWT